MSQTSFRQTSTRRTSSSRYLAAFALLLLTAVPAGAQSGTKRWTTWMFQGENDSLALLSGSDEHYTNGVRFYGLLHPEFAPRPAERFARWWCRRACPELPVLPPSFGFAAGHLIYTPDDLSVRRLITEDRPYAGWLYGATLLQITDDRLTRQHSFELQLGILGPETGAEWIQTELHRVIGDEIPMGWDNQLPTEPGVNLIYGYRRRVGCDGDRTRGCSLDFVPHIGGAVGTIMVMTNVGGTVRAGWNITGFPQTLIPTTAARTSVGERPKWEFYVFAGADGRAVAHNVFLDGTVFSNSHSVDREDFVYDLKAGFSLRFKSFRFQYTFVRRSEEFSPRRGRFDGVHDFGSLSIGVERSF